MRKINLYKILFAFVAISSLTGCKKLFDETEISSNPNAVTDVEVTTLLSGTLLGVGMLHEDTDVRIASIFAGELNGLSRQHQGYAQYIVSSQNFTWTTLYPVAGQARLIQTKADELGDQWLKGVGQVLEALVIAKATDLYGDVPYSQAFDDVTYPTPVFDAQADVYAELQSTLDDAITNLSASTGLSFSAQDFFYQGDVDKWKAAAYTLKARLYLHLGNYSAAIESAKNGISSTSGDALVPHGSSQDTDINLNYGFFAINRTGDTGFDGAYLPTLMQSRIDSDNTKTDETALYNHYFYVGYVSTGTLDPNVVDGAFTEDAPHPILTYYENQLILAEAYARTSDNASALEALNSVRTGLASGYINGKTFSSTDRLYTAYTLSDFDVSGLANPKNYSSVQSALLYEIISQRYIVLLMQYEAFNDVRRLAYATPVIQLDITPYTGTSLPSRFIYPQEEINTNPNVPNPVPDQWEKLPIYQ
ncbi:MAG: SusD/RagB family nutrient-binding outer membrane lipoprotein [Siphonobacter sp.]